MPHVELKLFTLPEHLSSSLVFSRVLVDEHLDFIWAMDAASTCYSDIIATIKLFENQ
jgi:hypothetical protein